METKKINNLVEMAKRGCEESLAKISVTFSKTVNELVERSWYKVPDPVAFEDYCYELIDYAVRKHDLNQDFAKLINYTLHRAERKYIKRKKETKSQTNLVFLDSFSKVEDLQIQIIDVLADVESEVITKEKITALARDDNRRFSILSHWKDGLYCDSTLAKLLAQRYGGKEESHRKFIQRFRTECQHTLSQVS